MLDLKRYTTIRLLGEGGFARVHLVVDEVTGEEYALKELIPQEDEVSHLQNLEKLLMEFTLLVALPQHSNVVRVFETDFKNGYLMEAFGASLTKNIHLVGKFRHLIQIMMGIFQGLNHFHQNGKLHLDVKPSNVLISRDQYGNIQVKLTDPLVLGKDKSLFFGTSEYAAPEFMAYVGGDSPKADMFAAGIIFYQLLFGSFRSDPWGVRHDSDASKFYDFRFNRKPRSLKIKWPEEIRQLIAELLSHRPKKRPDASSCIERLKPFLEEEDKE